MTDRREDADCPTGEVDATGEPLGTEQVAPPQQAPMDDAAGGPQVDGDGADIVSTDDLSVQGGD